MEAHEVLLEGGEEERARVEEGGLEDSRHQGRGTGQVVGGREAGHGWLHSLGHAMHSGHR